MNSKQRAKLKAQAHDLDVIIQVGKNGVTDELINVVNCAFNNKTLIKIKLLESNVEDKQNIAAKIALATQSEVVQVIGSKVVLYKEQKEDKKRVKKIQSSKSQVNRRRTNRKLT